MSIESENAKEEIKEIVDSCIKCGLCKANCPSFDVFKQEPYCPRGLCILFKDNAYGKNVYDFCLDKSCKTICPVGIDIDEAVIKARKILVENKKEIPEIVNVINNLNKTGNIFGIRE